MQISDSFDSGNILVRGIEGQTARLAIKKDFGEDGFFQWFHFRLSDVRDQPVELVIENAGEASYTAGWEGYRACASYDRETWFRCDTHYAQGQLTIELTPEVDTVWIAYFAPYSRERHHSLIAACQLEVNCRHSVIGQSVDGEDIDLLTIGEPGPDKQSYWAIARQHPGETQAEWWMEGFLERLLDPDDPVTREILRRGVFYVVPNMNPDGSRRGHLRTNAAGANLNREWETPTSERSPEVLAVRNKMDETGLDFFIDVHGDEGLPYVFIAGAEGVPGFDARQDQLLNDYQSALVRANPDFQIEKGYPKARPGTSTSLAMATRQVSDRFKGLAMTLEMPFKDNANAPDLDYGWSPARCRLIGRGCLDALYHVIDDLR
jgi:murein tripeptide amidase MpaA